MGISLYIAHFSVYSFHRQTFLVYTLRNKGISLNDAHFSVYSFHRLSMETVNRKKRGSAISLGAEALSPDSLCFDRKRFSIERVNRKKEGEQEFPWGGRGFILIPFFSVYSFNLQTFLAEAYGNMGGGGEFLANSKSGWYPPFFSLQFPWKKFFSGNSGERVTP